MLKRLVSGTAIVATAGGMFMGLLATPASACTDTVQTVVPLSCDFRCPPPTQPRAAVYVDGHWVVVCY